MRSNPSSALQMGNKWKPESVKALNLLSEAWLHWWRGRGEDESLTRCSGMMWRCTGTGMWLNCENPANKQEKQDELLNHTFTVSHSGMSTQFPAWLLFLNSLSESSFLNTLWFYHNTGDEECFQLLDFVVPCLPTTSTVGCLECQICDGFFSVSAICRR